MSAAGLSRSFAPTPASNPTAEDAPDVRYHNDDRSNTVAGQTSAYPWNPDTANGTGLTKSATYQPAQQSAVTQPASPGSDRDPPSRTMTIQLDGSALAQWTLQQLERALSKPQAGMTGVDPRTTIPRQRVSPFW